MKSFINGFSFLIVREKTLGGSKMAKLDKVSTVSIVDTKENTELKYLADTEPKKSTLGNSVFGTLNSKGYTELQAQGHKVYNESDYCDLIKKTFNLSDDAVGNRGPKWDTVEARQRYKVYIDGVAFEPEFTAKQKAAIEKMEIAIPKVPQMNAEPVAIPKAVVPEQPQIVVPPAPAVADTTQVVIPKPIIPPTPEEMAYVETMKGYIAQGKWTKEQLIESLSGKIGVEQATKVYEVAQ